MSEIDYVPAAKTSFRELYESNCGSAPQRSLLGHFGNSSCRKQGVDNTETASSETGVIAVTLHRGHC